MTAYSVWVRFDLDAATEVDAHRAVARTLKNGPDQDPAIAEAWIDRVELSADAAPAREVAR